MIDGKKTSHDYVYMHLKKPSPLHKGERVRTGQKIGIVGATGRRHRLPPALRGMVGPGLVSGRALPEVVTKHLKQWDTWS